MDSEAKAKRRVSCGVYHRYVIAVLNPAIFALTFCLICLTRLSFEEGGLILDGFPQDVAVCVNTLLLSKSCVCKMCNIILYSVKCFTCAQVIYRFVPFVFLTTMKGCDKHFN